MNATLYHDLSTDRNMSWVWSKSCLTYLSLDAPSNTVTYDLGIGADGILHLASFDTPPMAIAAGQQPSGLPAYLPALPMGTPQMLEIVLFLLAPGGAILLIARIAQLRMEQAVFLRKK